MTTKKFFWLKLRRDFFKRHDVRILKAMPDGERITLFYIELLAESVDHEGALRYSPTKPYTPDMLAVITDTDAAFVAEALEVLESAELITTDEDGTINLPKAKELIGSAADNYNALKQARYRERQKETDGDEVTQKGNTEVTKSNTVTERYQNVVTKNNESKRKSKSKSKSKSIDRESIEREIEPANAGAPSPTPTRFIPPSPDDILDYMTDYSFREGIDVDTVVEAEKFFNHFSSNGWRVSGRAQMKDYKAACRNWLLRAKEFSNKPAPSVNPFGDLDI